MSDWRSEWLEAAISEAMAKPMGDTEAARRGFEPKDRAGWATAAEIEAVLYANYGVRSDFPWPIVAFLIGQAYAVERVQDLPDRQPCTCRPDTPVGIGHHAATRAFNEALASVRAALGSPREGEQG